MEKDVVQVGRKEEQWKTDRKRGPEKSSKHEMSMYQ